LYILIKLNIRAKVQLDSFTQLKVIYLKIVTKYNIVIAQQLTISMIKFVYQYQLIDYIILADKYSRNILKKYNSQANICKNIYYYY